MDEMTRTQYECLVDYATDRICLEDADPGEVACEMAHTYGWSEETMIAVLENEGLL